MVAFVIPVKSKAVSRDWRLTSGLLAQTLASIAGQKFGSHETFLVVHEVPEIDFPEPESTHIIPVNFSSPAKVASQLLRWDKERKLRLGLKAALAGSCTHVMKLDSDDCISWILGKYIEKNEADAYIFNHGIVFRQGSRLYQLEKTSFHCICGSSSVFAANLFRTHPQAETIWDFFCSDSHERVVEKAREWQIRYLHPPFPAVCYVCSADVRLSDLYHPVCGTTFRQMVGKIRRTRLLGPKTRAEFALQQ